MLVVLCSTIVLIDFLGLTVLRHLFVGFLIVLVSGCAARLPQPEGQIDLPEQLSKLRQISTWEIGGKLAIKHPDQSLSANLRWQTQQPDFEFRLSNFLGITLVDMQNTRDGAVLEADGEIYTDPSASLLLYQMTGWDIPVNQLLSWIKGVPKTGDIYQLDEHGLVSELKPACQQCAGWIVSYSRYQQVDDVWLPHALTLTNPLQPDHSIKIRIYKWTLN